MSYHNTPFILPMPSMLDDILYFTLADGRVWSVEEAKFVESVPEGAVSGTCPDSDGVSTVDGLLDVLRWRKLPLGEFATDEDLAPEARAKRDALLAETDFMMMPDYPLSEAKRAAVAAYRQALRDVPAQYGFPRQINWPLKTF